MEFPDLFTNPSLKRPISTLELDAHDGNAAASTSTEAVVSAPKSAKPPAKRRAAKPLPLDAVVTDKSCLRCRVRKVKCDRLFPKCTHCTQRREECDLHTLAPMVNNFALAAPQRKQIARLEQRLAQLEEQITSQGGIPEPHLQQPDDHFEEEAPEFDFALDPEFAPSASSSTASTALVPLPDIGESSLDWRLATPQMAFSLSQHLCCAFFDSCCVLLPTVAFFSEQEARYRGDLTRLDGPGMVVKAAFCAIGARSSEHSALLGIETFSEDKQAHPEAPLLSAGTRRQNACETLVNQAHTLGYEQNLMDEATVENLSALLALCQMFMFVEVEPKKSRTWLRGALAHFKELQDVAATEAQRIKLKLSFAFAIYYADSVTCAWARKPCLVSENDLRTYFDRVGIVVPPLPREVLIPILENVLSGLNAGRVAFTKAVHLVSCWTCHCQRMFSALVSGRGFTLEEQANQVTLLWAAIDKTRAGVQYVQGMAMMAVDSLDGHLHSASADHKHSHQTDYASQVVRSDRDLLDLISMIHVFLLNLPPPGLLIHLEESTSRVRKGLKVLAYYSKLYTSGADAHMIYHHVFQLECNPAWTKMAVQRVGEPGGPRSEDEEVTPTEISWLVEGLQRACFYTPTPELRLSELSPRSRIIPLPNLNAFPWDLQPEPFRITPAARNVESNIFDFVPRAPDSDTYASLFADGFVRDWDPWAGGLEFDVSPKIL